MHYRAVDPKGQTNRKNFRELRLRESTIAIG